MKKLLIIGTIDETHSNVSGQYDRTEIIKDGLKKRGYKIKFVNMMNWKRNPIAVFLSIAKYYYKSDAVIFLASLNGTRVILNLIALLGIIKTKPAYQIAIGGQSNYKFIEKSLWYRRRVSKLTAVFVEVESMVEDYKALGIKRVMYLPNCKKISINNSVLHNAMLSEPFRFCTYSRVTPDKGIAEAISVVEELNKKMGRTYCTLDIYGTYLPEDAEWFKKIMALASSTIKYIGRIERKDSVATLSQYDLMLFPTKHTGEGVPGGMIDCYEAGLPIVTCNTSYMKRIVHDGDTGFVYDGNSLSELKKAILRYTNNTKGENIKLRMNCQKEAEKYDTEAVITKLSIYIDRD